MKKQSENIKRLEELILGVGPGKFEYTGGITGQALFKETDVAVQVTSCRGPVTLECHAHDSVEVIVVFSGQFFFRIEGGDEVPVGISQIIRIPGGKTHSCRTDEAARAIGILIPAEKGYPDVVR
jgi:mannose-6-phosphate isomerase-like protein (cupin superfamily)